MLLQGSRIWLATIYLLGSVKPVNLFNGQILIVMHVYFTKMHKENQEVHLCNYSLFIPIHALPSVKECTLKVILHVFNVNEINVNSLVFTWKSNVIEVKYWTCNCVKPFSEYNMNIINSLTWNSLIDKVNASVR